MELPIATIQWKGFAEDDLSIMPIKVSSLPRTMVSLAPMRSDKVFWLLSPLGTGLPEVLVMPLMRTVSLM